MNYVVDSTEFQDRWSTMLFTVSVNSTVLLLYALYLVLFAYSVHTLRRSVRGRKFLLGTAWVMFALATAGTVLVVSTTGISMRMVYLLVQGNTDLPDRLLKIYQSLALVQDIILAINNLVTDLLFLYRCYVIWGSRKIILVLPAMMILATVVGGCVTGLGYYGIVKLNIPIDPRVPFILGGSTNILMMCLTAGRIWYIRREVRSLSTLKPLQQRYNTVVAIILESGILYCLCVIIYVISISINESTWFGTVFNGVAWGLVQLGVNIVPTLILVRVGMGRSTENSTTMPTLSVESQPIFVSKEA
ncbi:hypothetical protein MSAN_00130400 [Mycena sanguinolenta]|uniref:Uncharacterized protein n=1 Tax=Mycena sanguinolenta TaxID=230812 RepID=A0A8H6ZGJ0_9AGAR|nr:hypothetical protein MSAN_00130400 [Mycena sanguinolenta]